MNAAEPPRILLEGAGPCPNPARLDAVLHSSVGSTMAPTSGWLVSLRVEKMTGRVLRAEGDITDGDGTPVARRVVSGSVAECEAVARAIGVWASLVLDAELSRPTNDAEQSQEGAAPTPAQPRLGAPGERAGSLSARSLGGNTSTPPASAAEAAGFAVPKETPEEDKPVREEPRTLELGVGTFLLSGPRGRAFAGASPYAVIETGSGIFIRPSLAVGRAFPLPDASDEETWATARTDMCLRMHGLYPANGGLKLDLCAGADAGVTVASAKPSETSPGQSSVSPFVALGPSLQMDGDLTSDLSLVLRGAGGVNLFPDGWSGRIELAISWRLR